jgi:replicative DNA helicase
MEYTKRSVNKDEERDIVIGLIVSSEFIRQIKPVYKKEYFSLPYAKHVSEWCIEYYETYEKAAEKEIIAIFESKKATIRDQDQIEIIEIFINKLNDRFEESGSFNIAYNVDRAVAYFKSAAIDNMVERIKAAKLSGDILRAESEISNFKRVEKGTGCSTSVWSDVEEAMKVVRQDDDDIIVKFPGSLGTVIRPLTSDDFVAFIGPAKRSKTWWLIETALQCSFNKKNVLFVSLEMPQKKIRERIFQRITGEVVSMYEEHDTKEEIEIPYFDINFEINNKILKRREYRNRLSATSIIKKMHSIKSFVKTDNFRLISEPSNTFAASALESALDNLENYDNFIPDAIIIDYGDILGSDKRQDHRNMINDKWESLRTIGQKRHVLMVTASHTNKGTFSRDCTPEDVVEDVRKLNHITLCVAINQLQEDKDNSVQRLSVVIDRVREFNQAKQAVVTQCFSIGGVCLDSRIRYKGYTVKE